MKCHALLEEAAVRAREMAALMSAPDAAVSLRKAADALARAAAAISERALKAPVELDALVREVCEIAALAADAGIEARIRRAQTAAFDAVGRLLDENVRVAIQWCEPLSDIGMAMRHLEKAIRGRYHDGTKNANSRGLPAQR